ncbi:MAG: TonB-dependent receptor [Alistipes sp.]
MNQFKLPCVRFRTGVVRWLALSMMMALCSPSLLFAQSYVITGKVLDETGLPVVGANVIVDGTTIGTNTMLDGTFSLAAPPQHKTLSVTYLGYKPVQLALGKQTKFVVNLVPDGREIDEVVVIAYGTQKKVSVTGSIASVGNTELKRSPVSNFSTALAGRLPGLNVMQTSGMPGDERVALNMRGLSTYGDSSPLILIDGVPRDDMNSLDANEVDNVTILKDAAATAVFGVRGANGVILVTTQRGKEGKAAVTITAEHGFQQMLVRGSLKMDSWDYAALLNELNSNMGRQPAYNEWQIQQFRDGTDPMFFPNRDPYDEYTKLGSQTKLNATLSGGTDKVQYFINAAYLHQGSVFSTLPESKLGYDPSFWLNRVNVRANIDYKITDRVKFSLNLSTYLNKVNKIVWGDGLLGNNDVNFDSPATTFVIGGLNRVPPTAPGPAIPAGAVDNNGKPLPEGGWVQDGSGYQLYPRMNLGGYIRQMKTTVNSSAAIDWDMGHLVKGLAFRAMVSYDLYAMGWLKGTRGYNRYGFHQATGPDDTSYFKQEYSDNSFDGTHAEDGLNFPGGGRGQSSYYKFNTQLSLNYNRTFNEKHDVHAMVLGQMDNTVSNRIESLFLPYNMLYISGRFAYTFDQRYTAEINVGVNGSEQFAKGKRFGVFPAVSLGWTVSQEKFIKDNVDTKWLDFLKLRASYGIVGNDRLADGARFLYMDDVRVTGGGPIPTLGRGQYVSTNLLGNPDLTWERSEQQNYGFDIGFLDGFTFNFDYFREMRSDILISRSTIPLVQGLAPSALPRVNMGKVSNYGYEMVLSYQKTFKKDWRIYVSGNYNFARNKVLEADEVKRQTGRGGYVYPYELTGFPMSTSWGLQVDYADGAGNGYINTEDDLAKFQPLYDKGGYVRSFLGQWKFVDQNEDGIIDAKDRIPQGYPGGVPEITYGATVSLSWKNLDFSMQWQGVAHKTGCYVVGMFGSGHLTGEWETHAWTKERFENGEKITYQALNGSTLASGAVNERSDYVLSDMSFVRLKNIEIGYSLPQKWMSKIGLGGIRVAVTGQNLWNTNNMKTRSMDPEQNNENQYPMTRNVSFSLQLKL